ncbi:DUF1684 domain-containing protein [Kribbella antibiotica]|uniref:DUF1684 domain-containing protein n=1 Tax=Kribbella antibiotica TaxID=190195 RepID=A0A4R4ZWH9_9ACTN|nr:DUF1684 domain-containing protein [Kribbella antibiotica]TDD62910.1 DUF1684 domain-containing protein [Kribbella antibiotica]
MSLETADWRRHVFALYEAVRSTADPAQAHKLWQTGRDELLKTHPASPVEERSSYKGPEIGAYRPDLRFDVAIDNDVEPVRWEVPSATDGVIPFSRVGVVHLPDIGDLDVWWLESYGGGLFVPVKDALAGKRTYGGGRYLIDTVKGADLGGDYRDGRLVIDLNFAYNPSCAYSPRWTCPLAPKTNTVIVPLPVGELTPRL